LEDVQTRGFEPRLKLNRDLVTLYSAESGNRNNCDISSGKPY